VPELKAVVPVSLKPYCKSRVWAEAEALPKAANSVAMARVLQLLAPFLVIIYFMIFSTGLYYLNLKRAEQGQAETALV
jgi:hypothetical protein